MLGKINTLYPLGKKLSKEQQEAWEIFILSTSTLINLSKLN